MTNNKSGNSIIDFNILYLKYKRYWYVPVLCMFIGIAGAWLLNYKKTTTFQAKASILLREERIADDFFPEAELMWEQNINNKKIMLHSHTIVESTISQMDILVSYYRITSRLGIKRYTDLYNRAPVRVVKDSLFGQSGNMVFELTVTGENEFLITRLNSNTPALPAQFNTSLSDYGYHFSIEKNAAHFNHNSIDQSYKIVFHNKEDLVFAYLMSLQVNWISEESRNSIAEITFAASHQNRAIDFLDQLLISYSQQVFSSRNRTANTIADLLDDRLRHTKDTLVILEREIEHFKRTHRFPDRFLETRRLMDELRLVEESFNMESAKNQYYKQVLAQIEEGNMVREYAGFSAHRMTDGYLNRLLGHQIDLHLERARLRETSTDQTLALRQLNNTIESIESDINDYLINVISASDIMINQYEKKISEVNERIMELPKIEQMLFELEREHELFNNRYNYLSERRMEAEISMLSVLPDHEIIDRAQKTAPISPKKKQSYIIALSLSLILPFTIVLLRESLNAPIIAEEVSQIIDKPIIGMVPGIKTSIYKKLYASPAYEQQHNLNVLNSFRNIRSNILLMSQNRCSIIVVTSMKQGEGKTYTATNLAKALAMSAYKVVYINADLRKPDEFTQPTHQPIGLSDYLFGEASLTDILLPAGIHKNHFKITNGSDTHMTTELLESSVMDELIAELQHFDYIIIDTSPIGIIPDAQTLLAKADLALFVVRSRYSKRSDLDFINNFCQNTGLTNVAVSVNDVKDNQSYSRYQYANAYKPNQKRLAKNTKKSTDDDSAGKLSWNI